MQDMRARVEVPSTVTAVIGALPAMTPEVAARFALETTPHLPGVDVGVGSAREAAANAEFFVRAVADRTGPILVSMLGPCSRALGAVVGSVVDDQALRGAVREVNDVIDAVLGLLASSAPEAVAVVMLDEPALVNGEHPSHPLDASAVGVAIGSIVSEQLGAVVGVRVPGRADIATLLDSGIGLLGIPVGVGVGAAMAAMAEFVTAGGVIAWGAVPVNEPIGDASHRLWRRLASAWAELVAGGADPVRLRDQALITAAGSLDRFTTGQARQILGLADDLAQRARTQVMGARMGIGA